jgi:hypothetical protein
MFSIGRPYYTRNVTWKEKDRRGIKNLKVGSISRDWDDTLTALRSSVRNCKIVLVRRT